MLSHIFLLSILWFCSTASYLGNYPTCCNKAIQDKAYLNKSIPQLAYICDQNYSPSLPPAPNLEVTYDWCKSNCIRWGDNTPAISKLAPILQYTLPAVVFGMTIPRRLNIAIPSRLFRFQFSHIRSIGRVLASLIFGAVVIVADTIMWVISIFAGAGPMLFSGLHEALIDYRIITYFDKIKGRRLELRPNVSREEVETLRWQVAEEQIEIMIALMSGNLDRETREPQRILREILMKNLDAQKLEITIARLTAMMSSQPSFGSAVGGAVLFYVGSFTYNILNIQNMKGDVDTADALAFGMWWMTIVHVSIVAGCLFASNNPSTTATLAGLPLKKVKGHWLNPWTPVYPSIFQPVWMWQRGDQKMLWVRDTRANDQREFKAKVDLSYGALLSLAAVATSLVLLPALLAFLVEYFSPKVGLGCRSLTVSIYFCSQVVLILVKLIMSLMRKNTPRYLGQPKGPKSFHEWVQAALQICQSKVRPDIIQQWAIDHTILLRVLISTLGIFIGILTLLAIGAAIFTTFAGTLMEIIGVYHSCLCGVSATAWGRNIDSAILFLASDTAGLRASANLWSRCGYAAVVFMSIMCYIGYWYQRYLREKFILHLEEIKMQYEEQSVPQNGTAASNSTPAVRASPLLPLSNGSNSFTRMPSTSA